MLTSQALGAAYAPQVGSINVKAMTRAYAGAARSLARSISEHLQGDRPHDACRQGDGGANERRRDHRLPACGDCGGSRGQRRAEAWLGVDIPVHPAKGRNSRATTA